jgi:hypothetical protein
VQIGDETYLLPVESSVMMALPGLVNRNWVRFAACRRFTGESTLSFADPVSTETALPEEHVQEVEIPAALTLQLQMPPLDLAHAAVGDPIRAILRADLRNHGQLLAPKGSTASGRIVRLDRYAGSFALQIQFQDLEWPGGHARLKLSFDQTALASRSIQGTKDGAIMITREAGLRLSGILMFWRSE